MHSNRVSLSPQDGQLDIPPKCDCEKGEERVAHRLFLGECRDACGENEDGLGGLALPPVPPPPLTFRVLGDGVRVACNALLSFGGVLYTFRSPGE